MTARAQGTPGPDFETVYNFLAERAVPEAFGPAVDAFNEFGRAMRERAFLICELDAERARSAELLAALEMFVAPMANVSDKLLAGCSQFSHVPALRGYRPSQLILARAAIARARGGK